MRIRADDDCARRDVAFFDHHLMANALMQKMRQFLFFHEFNDLFVILRRQNIRGGVGMIKMNHDFVFIKNRFANIAKGFDGERRGVVVTHNVVHVQ